MTGGSKPSSTKRPTNSPFRYGYPTARVAVKVAPPIPKDELRRMADAAVASTPVTRIAPVDRDRYLRAFLARVEVTVSEPKPEPRPIVPDLGKVARKREARLAYARQLLPIVREIQARGIKSPFAIGRELERLGVKTPRGNSNWECNQVEGLIDRMERLLAEPAAIEVDLGRRLIIRRIVAGKFPAV